VKSVIASRLGKAGIAIPVPTGSLDAPIEAALKRRITTGYIVAVLLTFFLGFSSWRSIRLAGNDADWIAHTYAVMDAIELMTKHAIEAETSARTFALTGQDTLLPHYEAARDAVLGDGAALRSLTADNPNQQRRLDVLEPQAGAALEFAATLIAKRQRTGAAAGASEILRPKISSVRCEPRLKRCRTRRRSC